MSQNQQFQPPGGVLQGMGTLPKQQEQPQQTGSAGLEQLQQQPQQQQQQQQQQRKAYETVHKPLQSYSPQPDVPSLQQGRHAWTEEETVGCCGVNYYCAAMLLSLAGGRRWLAGS